MSNPKFYVRFYLRPTGKKTADSPTPLRAKVRISDSKSYLYFTTKVNATQRMWENFSSDGKPNLGADPSLTESVDTYRTAANLILSAAIANGRIKDMTSEQLSLRIDAVVDFMKKRQAEALTTPLLVFTTPEFVPLCKDCKHCGHRCEAEWNTADEADVAPDMALYTQRCAHYGMSQKQYLRSLMTFISDNALRNLLDDPNMPTDMAYRQLHPATIRMGGAWIEDALESAREEIRMADPLSRLDKKKKAAKGRTTKQDTHEKRK